MPDSKEPAPSAAAAPAAEGSVAAKPAGVVCAVPVRPPSAARDDSSKSSADAAPIPVVDERVAIWNTATLKKVAGQAAPMKRNLQVFLRKHPECEVYDGQDRDGASRGAAAAAASAVAAAAAAATAAAAEAEAEAKAPSLTDIRFYCPAPGPPRAFPQAAFQGDAADEQAGNIAMDLSDWSPLAEPSSPDLGGEAPPELLLSPQQMPVFPPPRRIGGEVTPPVVNAEPRHLERQYSRSPLHHDADAVMCEA